MNVHKNTAKHQGKTPPSNSQWTTIDTKQKRHPQPKATERANLSDRVLNHASVSASPASPCQNGRIDLEARGLGARRVFVGAGNTTRVPLRNRIGLHSSGTVACINGLFRNLSTCSVNPWSGLLQVTLQIFELGTGQSVRPSNAVQNLATIAGFSKFTNAYPMQDRLVNSTGRYTKLHVVANPFLSNSSSNIARDKPFGKFFSMTVVRSDSSTSGFSRFSTGCCATWRGVPTGLGGITEDRLDFLPVVRRR